MGHALYQLLTITCIKSEWVQIWISVFYGSTEYHQPICPGMIHAAYRPTTTISGGDLVLSAQHVNRCEDQS